MKISENQLRNVVKKLVKEQVSQSAGGVGAMQEARPIYFIADEIYSKWKNVNYAARPYLDAMLTMLTAHDTFGVEDGESIILYFLSNASSWRGPDAARIKAELKQALKE